MSAARDSASMFFVLLGDDAPLNPQKPYPLVLASSSELRSLAVPDGPHRLLDVDLDAFYSGHPVSRHSVTPAAGQRILLVQVDARTPQDPSQEVTASFIRRVSVGEAKYLIEVEARGVLRNMLIEDYVSLRFHLFETQQRTARPFAYITDFIQTSGLANVDLLKGPERAEISTKLANTAVEMFGAERGGWSFEAQLDFNPLTNFYLRSGTYVVVAGRRSAGPPKNLYYVNGCVRGVSKQLEQTHLIFSIRARAGA